MRTYKPKPAFQETTIDDIINKGNQGGIALALDYCKRELRRIERLIGSEFYSEGVRQSYSKMIVKLSASLKKLGTEYVEKMK